jgi:hypothetical protein
MINIRYLFLFALFSVSVFGLFQVKFKVQQLHLDSSELKRQLAHEKDTIHVLRAEWAHLNQPDRLDRLSKKFLKLVEVNSDKVLPVKPGSIITMAANHYIPEIKENKKVVKISYSKNNQKRKAIKWNYRERPALKIRAKK